MVFFTRVRPLFPQREDFVKYVEKKSKKLFPFELGGGVGVTHLVVVPAFSLQMIWLNLHNG